MGRRLPAHDRLGGLSAASVFHRFQFVDEARDHRVRRGEDRPARGEVREGRLGAVHLEDLDEEEEVCEVCESADCPGAEGKACDHERVWHDGRRAKLNGRSIEVNPYKDGGALFYDPDLRATWDDGYRGINPPD